MKTPNDKTKKDEVKTATCMVCGMKGEAKFLAHVGENAYKCAYCLFNKNNKEK